jgi:hypothetical protein
MGLAQAEFYTRFPDNLIRVENRADGEVWIRATRRTFGRERRVCFIRELAAEGFIPAEFQFVSNAGEIDDLRGGVNEDEPPSQQEWDSLASKIHWVVDASWALPSQTVLRTSHRRCGLLYAICLAAWVCAMGLLWFATG